MSTSSKVFLFGACEATIGSRIRSVRRQIGMSREELATKIGAPSDLLSQYEDGARPIPGEHLARLSAALNFELPVGRPDAAEDLLVNAGSPDDAHMIVQGLTLLRAFQSVEDPVIRQQIIETVLALAGATLGTVPEH